MSLLLFNQGEKMKQPDKWKETIDPFKIDYENFELFEVLGYPHARNDVFYCQGKHNNKKIKCFIKYGSKPDSNISHEVETITKLNFSFLPKIIEFNKSQNYVITKEIDGDRLSYILQTQNNEKSIDYMFEYGKTLAQIHLSTISTQPVKHRKFFDIPTLEYLEENELGYMFDYLHNNQPTEINQCFCHGDFHYANILWKNKKLVGVLDWELSGIGNKEFDIAWAIINRPSQKFLKTQKEVNEFLKGYTSLNTCNKAYVEYYMNLIYCHFISVDKENKSYQEFVRKKLSKATKKELEI